MRSYSCMCIRAISNACKHLTRPRSFDYFIHPVNSSIRRVGTRPHRQATWLFSTRPTGCSNTATPSYTDLRGSRPFKSAHLFSTIHHSLLCRFVDPCATCSLHCPPCFSPIHAGLSALLFACFACAVLRVDCHIIVKLIY